MEELIALLFQIAVELGIQVLASLGADWATESRRRGREGPAEGGGWWLAGFAGFGAFCGGVSLLVVPKLLLPTAGLQAANLALAPLVAGGLSYLVAARVWAAGGFPARHHFWRGFWFALAFGAVRLALAPR